MCSDIQNENNGIRNAAFICENSYWGILQENLMKDGLILLLESYVFLYIYPIPLWIFQNISSESKLITLLYAYFWINYSFLYLPTFSTLFFSISLTFIKSTKCKKTFLQPLYTHCISFSIYIDRFLPINMYIAKKFKHWFISFKHHLLYIYKNCL